MPRGQYDRTRFKKPDEQPVTQITNPIVVAVDWNTVPMVEGRLHYATLKAEFEKAGTILNARSMPHADLRYACFMCECTCPAQSASVYPEDHDQDCKKIHPGEARGKDDSYVGPDGLRVPVRICGELHWVLYQKLLIDERRQRNVREGTL